MVGLVTAPYGGVGEILAGLAKPTEHPTRGHKEPVGPSFVQKPKHWNMTVVQP